MGPATTTLGADGDGNRVTQAVTVGGTSRTTTYIGDLSVCEGTGTGTCCVNYIFAGDQRIAAKRTDTGAVTYFHPDHLGSTRVVTDGTGNKVQGLAYYPFGATRLNAGEPSAPSFTDTPYQYTGQEYDRYTGLYYYRARYYDPVLGRFIQPDPVVPDLYDPQSLNPYSYVLNNPLRYTDPSGFQTETIPGLIPSAQPGYTPYTILPGGTIEYTITVLGQGFVNDPLGVGRAVASLGSVQLGPPAGVGLAAQFSVFVPSVAGVAQTRTTGTGDMSRVPDSVSRFMADLPTVPQGLANAAAGFGSGLSFGLTDYTNVDVVDPASAEFRIARLAGVLEGATTGTLVGLRGLAQLVKEFPRTLHLLNQNRYLRVGPGRMPGQGSLPASTDAPRISIGRGPNNPHLDLRIKGIDY